MDTSSERLFEEVANMTQPYFFPPATPEEIEEAELSTGRRLPELLRRLYGVANGGFFNVLGLVRVAEGDDFTVLGVYLGFRDRGSLDGYSAWRWPAGMVPFAYHGCTVYSCVDLESGRVYGFDPCRFVEEGAEFDVEGGEEPLPATTPEEFDAFFVLEAESLERWFEDRV